MLFDLHNGSLIDIPGNSVLSFSASHQLAFISKRVEGIAENVSIYAVDLNTGEVLLSYDL